MKELQGSVTSFLSLLSINLTNKLTFPQTDQFSLFFSKAIILPSPTVIGENINGSHLTYLNVVVPVVVQIERAVELAIRVHMDL